MDGMLFDPQARLFSCDSFGDSSLPGFGSVRPILSEMDC